MLVVDPLQVFIPATPLCALQESFTVQYCGSFYSAGITIAVYAAAGTERAADHREIKCESVRPWYKLYGKVVEWPLISPRAPSAAHHRQPAPCTLVVQDQPPRSRVSLLFFSFCFRGTAASGSISASWVPSGYVLRGAVGHVRLLGTLLLCTF